MTASKEEIIEAKKAAEVALRAAIVAEVAAFVDKTSIVPSRIFINMWPRSHAGGMIEYVVDRVDFVLYNTGDGLEV